MRKIMALALLSTATLCACAPANITAAKWDSGEKGVNVQTRCERVDMRDSSEMDKTFQKYDGWKLIYVSEYTTSNKVGTDAAVCFERTK